MARVPVYSQEQVNVAPLPTAREGSRASADMFGLDRGRSMEQTGRQVQAIGDLIGQRGLEAQARRNEAEAQEAYTEWLTGVSELNTEFMQLRGLDPAQQRDAFNQRLDQLTERTLADRPRGVTSAVQPQIANRRLTFSTGWDEFQFNQTEAARQASFGARAAAARDVAIAAGPSQIAASIQEITAVTAQELEGMPPNVIAQATRERVSEIHEGWIGRLVDQGRSSEALSYRARFAGALTGEAQARLDDALRVTSENAAVGASVEQLWATGSVSPVLASPVDAVAPSGVTMPAIDPTTGGGTEALYMAFESAESGGRADAISHAGAAGVMQVMPGTARDIARSLGETAVSSMGDAEITEWLKEPDNSRRYGRLYLDRMLRRYGHPVLAAAAYNAGPGRADEWIERFGNPAGGDVSVLEWARQVPFQETRQYILGRPAGTNGSNDPGYRGIFDRLHGLSAGQWAERGGQAGAPPVAERMTGRAISYGDSLAVGYAYAEGVEARATEGAGFTNGRLPDLGAIEPGDTVMVSVGANDAGMRQGEYSQRMMALGQQIIDAGGRPVFVGIPETAHDRAPAFNRAAEAAAGILGGRYEPPRAADAGDGVHYTGETYREIASAVTVQELPPDPPPAVSPDPPPAFPSADDIELRITQPTRTEQIMVDAGIASEPPPRRSDEVVLAERYRNAVDGIRASGAGPERQQRLLAGVTERYRAEVTRLEADRAVAMHDAYRMIDEGTMPGSFDPALVARLGRENMAALTTYANERNQITTNNALWSMVWSQGDEGLVATDLTQLRPYLERDDYNALRSEQEAARERLSGNSMSDPFTLQQQLGAFFDEAGLEASSNREERGRLERIVAQSVAYQQRLLDRDLTFEERQQTIDRLMWIEVEGSEGGLSWGGRFATMLSPLGAGVVGAAVPGFGVGGGSSTRAFEVDEIDEVPATDRQALFEASQTPSARAAGIPVLTGPDDPRLPDLYLQLLISGALEMPDGE